MCRDPPPANPPAQKFIDASTLNDVPQEQLAEQPPTSLYPLSLRNVDPPSPRSNPQISPQKANHNSEPVSPESHGGSAGVDERKNERPDASSSVMLQNTPSDAVHDCSGSNTPQINLVGPGMLLFSMPSTCTLHRWRFGSEYR